MNIIGDLGVYELVGFIFTTILIIIIGYFISKGIPHDSAADFRALGERYGT